MSDHSRNIRTKIHCANPNLILSLALAQETASGKPPSRQLMPDCFNYSSNPICIAKFLLGYEGTATASLSSFIEKRQKLLQSQMWLSSTCGVCGQETRVIPRILQLRSHWMKSEKESVRLVEAGITKEVLNGAIAQFCLEIIAKHGDPAPRLCNKDPLTLKMGTYVIELFPEAKFLFMVRDGRATVHSIISRKVTITGFDLSNYRQCMTKWNQAIQTMHDQCKEIGKERCMMVYYEQLVLHPEEWMRKILHFLDIPWNDSVLHHEEFINKENGVALSKVERSSDQVIKPVNLEALSKWVDHIPEDVVRDMAEIAPMLSVLGYDPYANPPDYGKPDSYVQENTYKVQANPQMWEHKVKELLNRDENQPPKANNINNNNEDEDDYGNNKERKT
ncbi:hypothetical protein RP20_CCG010032 [Aedes albopictus]|nr:hypothetical protein RP20_CCG010032 [Aedes albopictus]